MEAFGTNTLRNVLVPKKNQIRDHMKLLGGPGKAKVLSIHDFGSVDQFVDAVEREKAMNEATANG